MNFEEKFRKVEGVVEGDELDEICKLTHKLVDGAYVREIFVPAGFLLTTKIHKVCHPFFAMKGKCSVFTENGEVTIEAPHWGITFPSTKRLIYAHTDTIWVTVHATKETDLEKIEEQIIAKTFEECIPFNDNKERLL